jgi:Flp pilus assembly protein TadG
MQGMKEHIMNSQQGFRAKLKSRQQGAVAIIVALSLVVLIGMLGLVLDLGHLYVTKTELQNAADASALSGAKELNGRLTGINNAINRAIETAGRNQYNLNSQALVITSANIRVGACPAAGCMVPITSITTDALAANKTFLEVNTGSQNMNTWFAQVLPNIGNNMATLAVAVAGKYAADITPIAICRMPDPGTANEFGYERGVSYKVSDANPIGPGTMFWIDPESNAPGVCPVTNTNGTRPYVCAGKTGFTPVIGGTVNTNTGISTPQLESLDSRFDSYGAQGACDPATAPPDSNIKQYLYGTAQSVEGSPNHWMVVPNPLTAQADVPLQHQGITFVDKATNGTCLPNAPCKPKPYSLRSAIDYGVLWSRYRPAAKTVSDWSSLYSGITANSYPEVSPYEQTDAKFFQAPSVSHPGVPGRRVLNMVIVDCSAAGGVCRPAEVLAVGRFFMQRKSNVATDREIYVEFGGLLPSPLPTSDIKLYR